MTDREVSETRACALLKERAVTAAERRSAYVTLADLALTAADGDRDTAETLLRGPLEAVGGIPYPVGAENGKKRCGRCGKVKPAGAFAHNSRTADRRSAACRECKNGGTP